MHVTFSYSEVRPSTNAINIWIYRHILTIERRGRKVFSGRAYRKPKQQEDVMEIVTSWMEQGLEQGIHKGVHQE